MELFYRQAGFLHDIKSDASEPQKGSAQHAMHLIYDLYVCKDFVHELFETYNMKPLCWWRDQCSFNLHRRGGSAQIYGKMCGFDRHLRQHGFSLGSGGDLVISVGLQ